MNNFLTPIKSFLFRSKKTFSEIKDELEELLLVADVGVDATKKLLNELTHDKNVVDAESAYAALKKACLKIVKMDPRLRGDDNDGGMTKIKSPLPGGEGVRGRVVLNKLSQSSPKQPHDSYKTHCPTIVRPCTLLHFFGKQDLFFQTFHPLPHPPPSRGRGYKNRALLIVKPVHF